MAIVLRNNTGRRLSFELPHNIVCSEDSCFCEKIEQRSQVRNPESGEIGMRVEEVKAPSAIFLSAKGTSPPLPESVLEIPAIDQHLKRGTLIREDQQPPGAAYNAAPSAVIGERGSAGYTLK